MERKERLVLRILRRVLQREARKPEIGRVEIETKMAYLKSVFHSEMRRRFQESPEVWQGAEDLAIASILLEFYEPAPISDAEIFHAALGNKRIEYVRGEYQSLIGRALPYAKKIRTCPSLGAHLEREVQWERGTEKTELHRLLRGLHEAASNTDRQLRRKVFPPHRAAPLECTDILSEANGPAERYEAMKKYIRHLDQRISDSIKQPSLQTSTLIDDFDRLTQAELYWIHQILGAENRQVLARFGALEKTHEIQDSQKMELILNLYTQTFLALFYAKRQLRFLPPA